MKVKTTYWPKPIPSRRFDWSAIDDETYDASYEGEYESGHHWESSPQGFGATEQEAITHLLEQINEKS